MIPEESETMAAGKLAVLSNVNMNMVIRMLQKQAQVYETEGYGNELGVLLNPASSYHEFQPDITFLIMDLAELLEHDYTLKTAEEKIAGWFGTLDGVLTDSGVYYVSDVCLWAVELAVLADPERRLRLESLWSTELGKLRERHANVRIFPYRSIIEQLGEEKAFSPKMWYMGKVLLGMETQTLLADRILYHAELEYRTPKKVLVLDLDNTLWGGLAGEAEHTPVLLSEDHSGLAYKNLQRVLKLMQSQGVLLAVASKNNEADAMEILEHHPHMVLRPGDFVAYKINWDPKPDNIRKMAEELNLGTNSFVFFDDSDAEREMVRQMLPEVTVPDFPARPEDLPACMAEIYRKYFARAVVTAEDLEKTAQYHANADRKALEGQAASFEDYLKKLEICLIPVDPGEHLDRLTQLLNKTNQFNLTTHRYSREQLQQITEDAEKTVFLYQVTDIFGDNGIVAAAIVDRNGELPEITDFVMSCRVMGRNIENAVIDRIEKQMQEEGFPGIRGRFVPTAKNKPVETLYDRLGYRETGTTPEGGKCYEIRWQEKPGRVYYLKETLYD